MSTNFQFQLPFIPQTVVVFGCGGTGSRLIPPIAQLMSKLPTLISPEMVLVDFDVVEEKNLDRQNFAAPDVGKNKAQALAARYSRAFNLKITPITVAAGTNEYEEALSMFNIRDRLQGPTLYIIAVDSAKARRDILGKALQSQSGSAVSSVIIDCGNEDIFGQVSYFTTGSINSGPAKDLEFINNWYQGMLPGGTTVTELPIDVGYYANMQEGVGTKSCADLDQTLAINNLMAAQAVAVAQNLLMGKPMNYFRTNFDLLNGVSYDTITVAELLKRTQREAPEGSDREKRQFYESIQTRFRCTSTGMDAILSELSSTLEDQMLSGTPTSYETAKMIRESLGSSLQPFVASTMFAADFPLYYTDEFKALWAQGFVLPERSEENLRTYEIALRVMAEMQAETDALNAVAAAQPVATTGEDEEGEDEEGDDD